MAHQQQQSAKFPLAQRQDSPSEFPKRGILSPRNSYDCSMGGAKPMGIAIPMKRSSVTSGTGSIASIASSIDNPYVRMMHDDVSSIKRRSSAESLQSNDVDATSVSSETRKRRESSISEGAIPEIIEELVEDDTCKPTKKAKPSVNPRPFAKSKVSLPKKEGGGSKVFENYKAQIKQRTSHDHSGGLLTVPDIDPGSMQKGKSCESINNQDPDLGDSSRFVRRSHVRSTWSPSMRTVRKNEFEINHQQKKHFLQKLFKSPISKQL